MRRMLVALICVLTLALGLCFVSMYAQNRTLTEMKREAKDILALVRDERLGDAEAELKKLNALFREKEPILEMLTSHDDLHEASLRIVNAEIALECEDRDDACQALAELIELIGHLWSHEKFSLSNLY